MRTKLNGLAGRLNQLGQSVAYTNKISGIYIVNGLKVLKELENTIVECDINDNSPACNDLHFDKEMRY